MHQERTVTASEQTRQTDQPAALAGYRVLDLSGEEGQFCGRMLAGLGADVIKIEPPEGDDVRRRGPFFHDRIHPEYSLRWFTLNAGKRGITLNLASADGQRLFRRLAERADVVIESFPPGYLDRLGLGYAALAAANPGLVFTSITGYGQTGPLSDTAWCDLVALATGGLMYVTGDPDRPPVRMLPPQSFFHGSAQGTAGTMLALYHREVTGAGQQIDVSMQEAIAYTLEGPGCLMGFWTLQGINIARLGERRQLGADTVVPIILRCKDGWIASSGFLGNTFPGVLAALREDGAAGDLEDERWARAAMFAPVPGQWQTTQADLDHVYEIISAWMARHTKHEVYAAARRHRFLAYAVNDAADLLASEQLQARGYFVQVPHPELGEDLTYPGAPFRFSRTPWRFGPRAPLLGEHNAEVYGGELGLSTAELGTLLAARVI
jgi:crotonobetainyl-CoA:carnitine CoA-transferase CaiB-like acyl-CoA transferase